MSSAIFVLLGRVGKSMSSVPGEFYTTDRLRDLRIVVRELLAELHGKEAPVECRCPNCSTLLEPRRCKQVCASCGFFDDCSIGPA